MKKNVRNRSLFCWFILFCNICQIIVGIKYALYNLVSHNSNM